MARSLSSKWCPSTTAFVNIVDGQHYSRPRVFPHLSRLHSVQNHVLILCKLGRLVSGVQLPFSCRQNIFSLATYYVISWFDFSFSSCVCFATGLAIPSWTSIRARFYCVKFLLITDHAIWCHSFSTLAIWL